VQQFKSEFPCFDGLLNSCLDRCLDIMKYLDAVTIHHIPRQENSRLFVYPSRHPVSTLVKKKIILERPMFAFIENKSTCSTLLGSRVLLVHASVQKLAVQCN
jgi:hypothetical protein